MPQVQRQRTPLSTTDIVLGLGESARKILGRNLTPHEGLALLTLVTIETGHGNSVMNYNWGNLATSPDSGRNWWLPTWMDDSYIAQHPEKRDKLLALRQAAYAGKAPRAFRAYSNPKEGALDFMRVIDSPTHRRILDAKTPTALWKAVTKPHPETKMSYCHPSDCDNEATLKAYRAVWKKLRSNFPVGAPLWVWIAGGVTATAGLIGLLHTKVLPRQVRLQ